MAAYIEAPQPIAWDFRLTIDGESSAAIFSSKAIADAERQHLQAAYGNHACVRVTPVYVSRHLMVR
jgi:hypothetical protein